MGIPTVNAQGQEGRKRTERTDSDSEEKGENRHEKRPTTFGGGVTIWTETERRSK